MAALCSQKIRNERYWNTCAIRGAKDALLPFVSSKLSKKTYREKLICAYPYTLANAWWDNNSCLLFKSSHYLTFHSYDNLSRLGKVEPYSSYICMPVCFILCYIFFEILLFVHHKYPFLFEGTYFCNTSSIYRHKIQTSQSASDHEPFLFFSILFLSCHSGTS